jgi:hypothetical protein
MGKVSVLTVMTVLLSTASFAGGCGGASCATGSAGQGGIASDGKAQGFHIEQPSLNTPTIQVTNVGNLDAGHIVLSGDLTGTLSGTYRKDIGRGRETGAFGDGSGHL